VSAVTNENAFAEARAFELLAIYAATSFSSSSSRHSGLPRAATGCDGNAAGDTVTRFRPQGRDLHLDFRENVVHPLLCSLATQRLEV
jgi:hypothetical protein